MATMQPRNARVVGAVNIGSSSVTAIIAAIAEGGEVQVLGSGQRASKGMKRGYVVDMAGATFAVREALEKRRR